MDSSREMKRESLYTRSPKCAWIVQSRREGLTLNSLGTMSLGVSTPTSMSTPQKMRMARMMAKSLMSFLTWADEDTNT